MKKFRRMMALLLAMVMVLSMGITAFAEQTPDPVNPPTQTDSTPAATKTITLTGGKAGHTYTLYQIFTGKTTTNENELVGIQWGSDANATFKAAYDTAAAAAESMKNGDARTLSKGWISSGYLGTGTAKNLAADGNVVFDNLAEGYYLVVDTSGPATVTEGDYYSAVVVQVVADVNMALKGSAPTSEKKVDDKNDSNTSEDATTWQDTADYDIGDAVPFQLKATAADNVQAYKKYHITFQDKKSAGLNAPTGNYTIKVLDQTLTLATDATAAVTASTEKTNIKAELVNPAEGNTFAIKVTLEPKEGTYLTEGNEAVITVDYTMVLNSSAVIGNPGNPNESYILYSNNPEDADDSDEGKTPKDTVVVFTYKADIDKVDETGAALNGADFTLYKEVADSTVTGATKGSDITFADGVEHSKIKANSYYVVVGNKTGSATGSTFEFKGIDDGVYVLVETTVPAGYNAYESKEVSVTAEHNNDPDDLVVTSLTASAPFTAYLEGAEVTTDKGNKETVVSGELFAEIVNNSGATLPETGGMGTTLFYIVGAVLVIGAGVVLVSRRRMGAN